jgi:hypothetical protein
VSLGIDLGDILVTEQDRAFGVLTDLGHRDPLPATASMPCATRMTRDGLWLPPGRHTQSPVTLRP